MMEETKALGLRIELLEKQGADRFDPVLYRYITSLAQRAGEKHESVNRIIVKKVQSAIDDYQAKFERAREKTKKIVDRLSLTYPESADRLQTLFEKNDFEGVRQQQKKLNHHECSRQLADLTNQLSLNHYLDTNHDNRLTLFERMRQQEKEVLRSFSHPLTEEGETGSGYKKELRSFVFFKEVLEKHHAEQLVNDAIIKRPENPGHLNRQMLATRCLAAMRELSPDYLNRFVAYIDTLLWLEQH